MTGLPRFGRRRKQRVEPIRGYSRPLVSDGEVKLHASLALVERLGHHQHVAVRGELDGVRDEVDQHLPQVHGIADDGGGHCQVHLAIEVDAAFGRAKRDDVERLVDDVADVEGLLVEGRPARIEPPRIEGRPLLGSTITS